MSCSPASCAVIIVTHNSERHIQKAMECLQCQTALPRQIILVDSGSSDPTYLDPYREDSRVTVMVGGRDIGFCKGNNLGMTQVTSQIDYVFFLNPDAFLTPTFLEQAIAFMDTPKNQRCGALTSTVLGYDIDSDQPKQFYDTTGVFRKWYGKWYDRQQGAAYVPNQYQLPETIPAICGAVLFCRKKALDSIMLSEQEVFDNSFYMYKEDIDLSLRMRRQGWGLYFVPSILAYHCRGWKRDRSQMARKFRLCSARNELKIQTRLFTPIPIAYSLLKYAFVKLLDR